MEVFGRWESEIRGYCRAYPTVFVSSSNARQVDEQGKSFIDFFAGAGVLNFGHNNPRMKAAIVEYIQQDGITHSLDMYTQAKRAFIETFVEVILQPRGWDHRLQFMGPTGTNAVEAALKLARRVTGRPNVVAFHKGFHGMTLGSLALTANSYFRGAAGVPLNHVMHVPFGCETPCADCQLGCGMDSLNALRARFQDSSSGLAPPAAFVVEAIQAEGGVNVASEVWLQGVQQLASDLGALFIIDDIQAGCGRTGNYFSFDGMGLAPDIVCLAKGLGGFGTPIAMNLVKPEHDAHWSPGEHTGTFRGQNLSFVAGRIGLEYFRDGELLTAVRRKGGVLREALQGLASRYRRLGFQVRGKGMMQAIDLRDGALAKRVAGNCFKLGLIIGPCGTGGKVIKLIPPLTIPDDDLQAGLELLARAIDQAVEAA
ncbi:aspartate aminotransferase family protein [Candidatus Macondimonas diazotrophica]|jgi:diaminobutyrate-2-oxoglutarate transaminase|nr:aspartate aminotransferase family protein [Candidatus Macondimonas diazotrophica]HCO43240.1 diaminobutyrate--2-oxoglutarate transaminase [Gammaproteobacteria bacterium]